MTTENDTSTTPTTDPYCGVDWRREKCRLPDEHLKRAWSEVDRAHTGMSAILSVLQEDQLRDSPMLNDHHRAGLLDALAVLVDSAEWSTEKLNDRAAQVWPKRAA